MNGLRLKKRLIEICYDKNPDVLCLGECDVDILLRLDVLKLHSLHDRDTGHYEDNTHDLVLFYHSFDKLTLHQKDLIVRGAVRVLKPGGLLLLYMKNLDQEMDNFENYVKSIGCTLLVSEVTEKYIWVEVQKNAN